MENNDKQHDEVSSLSDSSLQESSELDIDHLELCTLKLDELKSCLKRSSSFIDIPSRKRYKVMISYKKPFDE